MAIDVSKIPAIMRANKWDTGAALMDSWFARKVNVAPKYGLPDTTTITMAWLLGFPRALAAYDALMAERIWQNEPGRKEIAKLLRARKLLTPGPRFQRSFGAFHLPVLSQDSDYVNQRTMDASDRLDDLTAALGRFVFNVLVAGDVASGEHGSFRVTVREVGIYIRDSYDFEGLQFLGFWNERTNEVSMRNPLTGSAVWNSDFRDWRTSHSKGGDFRVYSDVKRTVLKVPDVFDVA